MTILHEFTYNNKKYRIVDKYEYQTPPPGIFVILPLYKGIRSSCNLHNCAECVFNDDIACQKPLITTTLIDTVPELIELRKIKPELFI